MKAYLRLRAKRFFYRVLRPANRFLVLLAIFIAAWSCSDAQSWHVVGDTSVSDTDAYFPSIAIDGHGVPYAVYEDFSCGGGARVKKYNGTNWVTVGSGCLSAGAATDNSLVFNSNDTPYLAYSDDGYGLAATVKKFDGTSWVSVGSPGFSGGVANYTSLALNSSGTPYVAYSDGSNAYKATVMKYTGSAWVAVGSPGFSAGRAEYTALAIDGSGTPYVVFEDGVNNWRATVMKFDGSNWVNVGSGAISPDTSQYTAITIGPGDTPYVSFADGPYSTGIALATVMKFNGTTWVTVGMPRFSTSFSQYTSIIVTNSGMPCACYTDYGNAHKASAKWFDGSNWVDVGGTAGFSAGYGNQPQITKSSTGALYVAYGYLHGLLAGADKVYVMEYSPAPITGTATICPGDTAMLSDTTAGGTWSSNSTAIATVGSATGIVTAVAGGTVAISYTVSGISSVRLITVNAVPNAGSIYGYGAPDHLDTFCFHIYLADTSGMAGGTWHLTNTTVATISGSGLVMPIGYYHPDTALYIVSNACGSDTASFPFVIAWCEGMVKTTAAEAELLSVYPNPNSGSFMVKVTSGSAEEVRIEIVNMLGEKVKAVTTLTNTETEVQMNEPAGMYVITATTREGRKKVLVVSR